MINRLLKLPILFWHRLISPALPPMCRFYPSCAAYALEALDTLPWYRALALTAWRLLRCNPFCRGGFDPVPAPHGAVSPVDSSAAVQAAGCGCAAHASSSPRPGAADAPSDPTIVRSP